MVLLQQVVIPEIKIIPVPVINRLALFVRFPIDRIVTHHPIRIIKRFQPFLQFSCPRIPGSRKIRIFCPGIDLSGTSGEDLFPGDPVPICIHKRRSPAIQNSGVPPFQGDRFRISPHKPAPCMGPHRRPAASPGSDGRSLFPGSMDKNAFAPGS